MLAIWITKPRLAVSIAIGSVLSAVPFAVDRVDSLRELGGLADVLWMPGALLSAPIFPEGGHSGSGVANYAYIVGVLNFVFYGLMVLLAFYLRDRITSPLPPPSSAP